jgi:hypothetical protein
MLAGMVMALTTGRLLMVEPDSSNMQHYLDFDWDVDWGKHSHIYDATSSCNIHYNQLIRGDMGWCQGQNETATVMRYQSWDYDVPLLEVNHALRQTLQQYFPHGNIFHEVATRLFRPAAAVLAAMAPYDGLARDCLVGMHIRSQKTMRGLPDPQPLLHELAEQFTRTARAVALHEPGNVFVAADAPLFVNTSRLLPERHVWWTNLTASSIGSASAAGWNPGSDLSAFVDMFLLARCKHIVITSGSSFGSMAAAYSGTVPLLAIKGPHKLPYFNPYFWKGLSSEPHMYKVAALERYALSQDALEALQRYHPRLQELEQLHP